MDRKRKTKLLSLLFIAGALLFSLSCAGTEFEQANVGPLETKTEVVELGDTGKVRVDVRIGAGELEIGGGAEELLEAEFRYNIADWVPIIEQNDDRLVIRQPNSQKIPIGDEVRYEWDLRFNNEAPLDLKVDVGAGTGEFNLGDLQIERMEVKLGAGDITVDFDGNDTLQRLEMDVGAGKATLDLRGEWAYDVMVTIRGGVGETTLILPEDVGVRVEVAKGLGGINASGFLVDGSTYKNDAYGETEGTITVFIQAGIGQINLEVD